MRISDNQLNSIKVLCAKHKVLSLAVFGSVTRKDFTVDSDIDFVVDFNEQDPFEYANLYFQLKEHLEKLLKRHIDLIESRAIKNQFFKKELDSTKVVIYEH